MAGRFALFMAVKASHNEHGLDDAQPAIAQRDPSAVARWSASAPETSGCTS